MKTGSTPWSFSQVITVEAMNSRPLSDRIAEGIPWASKSFSRWATTAVAPMDRDTQEPSETLVNSSTTFKMRIGPPRRTFAETKS